MRPSKKKSENGQRVPWITKEILNSRKTKNVLYKRFSKNQNENKESIYKTLSLPLILIYQFYSHKGAYSLCSHEPNGLISFLKLRERS